LHQITLRGSQQGNTHALLQFLNAVEWEGDAVFDQADHAGRRRIVFLGADPKRRHGGEHLATKIAAQPVAGVHRRREWRPAVDAQSQSVKRVLFSLAESRYKTTAPTKPRLLYVHRPLFSGHSKQISLENRDKECVVTIEGDENYEQVKGV
jgi:inorganic triphosphatase YgiF